MKLSAVISTFNSESVIRDCLESLSFADEIVVIDHQSSDDTVKIVKKYTKQVYSQPNNPMEIDLQKNYGFSKAKGDWILSIDADERVSPELAKEIMETISADMGFSAYKISRKNIIFGKWIEHSIWWPDFQLRLFKKGKGKYEESKVHQDLKVEGTIGELKNSFVHENYQTISQYLQKMDQYTENEAKSYLAQNSHFIWIDALRMPARDFFKTFFLQEGFKDGFHGLVLSILQAFYMFLVIVKVWEKQGFRDENPTNLLNTLAEEAGVLYKEMSYWFLTSLSQVAKNPVQKISYRVKRKIISSKLNK